MSVGDPPGVPRENRPVASPLLQSALPTSKRRPATTEAGVATSVLGNDVLSLPPAIGTDHPREGAWSKRSTLGSDPEGAWPLDTGLPDLDVNAHQMLLPLGDLPEPPFS